MIHVIATMKIRPGKMDEFVKIFNANVPTVRAEDGCISYEPCLDAENPFVVGDQNVLTVVESWESIEHLKNHLASPHMEAYRNKTAALKESSTLRVVSPIV